ncbi:MAG: DeoR/GlpR family DNA-binding transcription regulator [Eubacteriales bacterium]
MLKEKRREKIIEYLKISNYISVFELSKKLNVSKATIRRDLSFLKKNSRIEKIHGGAALTDMSQKESTFLSRINKNIEEKKQIAMSAINLIRNNDVVFLDAGTTIFQLAKLLSKKKYDNLTVITNSIENAYILRNSDISLYVVGGTLIKDTLALMGAQAEQVIKNFHINKLFLAASGFDLDYGITTKSEFHANFKKILINISDKKILLIDSSKIGTISLNKIADIDKINILVTNSEIDRKILEKIRKTKIDKIIY